MDSEHAKIALQLGYYVLLFYIVKEGIAFARAFAARVDANAQRTEAKFDQLSANISRLSELLVNVIQQLNQRIQHEEEDTPPVRSRYRSSPDRLPPSRRSTPKDGS